MPCSSTYIHLLLTIISLQLSASLFFLYSVLKVHACGGHVAFFSGISANCSLAVIPSRKSLAVCHVAPRAITVPSHSPWFATCRGASRWWAQCGPSTFAFRFQRPLPHFASLLFDSISAAMVGSSGLEPPTSRLSGVRSNHLSYEPIFRGRLRFAFPAYLFVLPALRSRPSARNRCSQPFPFVRDMPRRQPLVEMNRIELSTPCLQGRCSPI